MNDRVSEIRVRGMRCLADVRLATRGLTVLVGENGAGKSTLLEALEVLRKAGSPDFFDRFYGEHRGLGGVLGYGASRLELGVTIEGAGPALRYDFALVNDGQRVVVQSERLDEGSESTDQGPPMVERSPAGVLFREATEQRGELNIGPGQLLISAFGALAPHPAISRMVAALRAIDVQLPFETTARWAALGAQRSSPMREATLLQYTDALARFGVNLASAYQALRNDFGPSHWEETKELVQLGLGYDVTDVVTTARPAPGPGQVMLALLDRRVPGPIPASGLSDGMLAYLAIVALCRLNTSKSLVAFDEAEQHFHPALLARVVQLFERLSVEVPVVLATQSDRLLDALTDAVERVVRCGLDERGATRLFRGDRAAYERWFEHYAGLGQMRTAGLEFEVLSREERP